MNIKEAIAARRSGVAVDGILEGLTKGTKPKRTVRDIYRKLKEAEDAAPSNTGISGKIGTALQAAVDKEGAQVGAAALMVALDKAPEDVVAAFDTLYAAKAPPAPEMPAPDAGGGSAPSAEMPDFGGADPLAGIDLGGAPEPAEARETDVEGATEGPDQGDLAGPQPEKKAEAYRATIKALKEKVIRTRQIGEAVLRRARRYKAERDHFRNKLGLTEAESNLDLRCKGGFCYDVRTNMCVRESQVITKLVNEMVADALTTSDPDKDQFEVPGEGTQKVGTTYNNPLGSPPSSDPLSDDKATVGGVNASRFTTVSGNDPLGGGQQAPTAESRYTRAANLLEQDVAPLPNTAAPLTFNAMNNGEVPDGFVWDEEAQRPMPANQFIDEIPGNTGTLPGVSSGGMSAAESRNWTAPTVREGTDPLGRPLANVSQPGYLNERTQARNDQVQAWRNQRYNIADKQMKARVSMVTEALTRFGADQVRASQLAERYVYERMMLNNTQQSDVTATALIASVPQQYAGEAREAVMQAMNGAPSYAGQAPGPMVTEPVTTR